MSTIRFISKDAVEPDDKSIQRLKETYDPRTLYERLQEQKQAKEDAFIEATKFSNLIKRIDEDEFEYLKTVEDTADQEEREKKKAEEEELERFRRAVKEAKDSLNIIAQPVQPDSKMKPPPPPSPTIPSVPKKDVTKSILAGAIVRKRSKDSTISENEHVGKKTKLGKVPNVEEKQDKTKVEKPDSNPSSKNVSNAPKAPAILSSLVAYSDDESGTGEDD